MAHLYRQIALTSLHFFTTSSRDTRAVSQGIGVQPGKVAKMYTRTVWVTRAVRRCTNVCWTLQTCPGAPSSGTRDPILRGHLFSSVRCPRVETNLAAAVLPFDLNLDQSTIHFPAPCQSVRLTQTESRRAELKPIPASRTGCQRLEFACSQNWVYIQSYQTTIRQRRINELHYVSVDTTPRVQKTLGLIYPNSEV